MNLGWLRSDLRSRSHHHWSNLIWALGVINLGVRHIHYGVGDVVHNDDLFLRFLFFGFRQKAFEKLIHFILFEYE